MLGALAVCVSILVPPQADPLLCRRAERAAETLSRLSRAVWMETPPLAPIAMGSRVLAWTRGGRVHLGDRLLSLGDEAVDFALAHEFAHIVLYGEGHRSAGRKVEESAADALALELLGRIGHPPERAIAGARAIFGSLLVWDHFDALHRTHPSAATRVRNLELAAPALHARVLERARSMHRAMERDLSFDMDWAESTHAHAPALSRSDFTMSGALKPSAVRRR